MYICKCTNKTKPKQKPVGTKIAHLEILCIPNNTTSTYLFMCRWLGRVAVFDKSTQTFTLLLVYT